MKKIFVITICIVISILFLGKIIEKRQNTEVANLEKVKDGNSKWIKYSSQPILGNQETGSLFDPNVILDEDGKYRMYVSWRKNAAIAVTQSLDRN